MAQWPQRGGSNGRYQPVIVQGKTSEPSKGPSGKEWSVPLGISDSETVVDGEDLFVTEADFTETGEEAHRISCFDSADGKRRWSEAFSERSFTSQDIQDRYPVRPLATPLVLHDCIVCAGFGGSVRCLDRKSGRSIWSIDLVKDYDAPPMQFGFATSPWSDGKQVLVGCGGPQGIVISLDLRTGKSLWKAGTGPASYGSFTVWESADHTRQLVYAAGNEVFGLDIASGKILWRYLYPQQGLTNAVTPIAVAPGRLLIGGQGVDGMQLLKIPVEVSETTPIEVEWKNAKSPFYCNWVQWVSHPELVVGFAGKTLFVLDWKTGKIVSQLRGWTDCNVTATEEGILAVRGDGFVGALQWVDGQLVMKSGKWVTNDRVWSPPVIVADRLFIRGRRGLDVISVQSLEAETKLPSATDVTSMDAMYGSKPEAIATLLSLVTESPFRLTWEDYDKVQRDRSVLLGEGDYRKILDGCLKTDALELSQRIADDWMVREPYSISALEKKVEILKRLGRSMDAESLRETRLVVVKVIVRIATKPPSDRQIFLAGNSTELGNWNPKGLSLENRPDGTWRASLMLPKGDLQYKVSGGDSDAFEVRADDRSISNRRTRITNATTLEIDVAKLPEKKSKP